MFLLTEISIEIVFGTIFLTFISIDIKFVKKKLIREFYNAVKALQTTELMDIIDIKKFAKAVLDKNIEVFIVNV